MADATVTATSTALQGEAILVTDAAGRYRLPHLPPGKRFIRCDIEQYRPYQRGGIVAQSSVTVRLNDRMLPEAICAEEIVVVATPPTVSFAAADWTRRGALSGGRMLAGAWRRR